MWINLFNYSKISILIPLHFFIKMRLIIFIFLWGKLIYFIYNLLNIYTYTLHINKRTTA
jgi:hypothetical protein